MDRLPKLANNGRALRTPKRAASYHQPQPKRMKVDVKKEAKVELIDVKQGTVTLSTLCLWDPPPD